MGSMYVPITSSRRQVGDRQFVTDSGLVVPAISLKLRERLEAAIKSHGEQHHTLVTSLTCMTFMTMTMT